MRILRSVIGGSVGYIKRNSMGLISRRKAGKSSRLTLKIEILEARIDTVEDSRCNPLCLVATNGIFNRTKKLRNTAHPQWRQVLKVVLPQKPKSEHLRVILYDDMLRKSDELGTLVEQERYLYLGEARLSLLKMFKDGDGGFYCFERAAEWYPVHNSQRQGYKAGEVMLGVALKCSGKFLESVEEHFKEWSDYLTDAMQTRRSLLRHDLELLTESVGQEQNGDLLEKMYLLSLESLGVDPTSYNDIMMQSVLSCKDGQDQYEGDDDKDSEYMIEVAEDHDGDGTDLVHKSVNAAPNESSNEILNTFADLYESSVTYITESSSSTGTPRTSNNEDTDLIKLSKCRRTLRKSKSTDSVFEISKKTHALGVVLLDILKITDLPPNRKKFSTSFNMDPFVIITFGRQVFKTSWKKHTLNPEYNERAAFEIYPNQLSFTVYFRVMDKDSFSFHDRIADASILLRQITEGKRTYSGEYVTELAIPLFLKQADFFKSYFPMLNLKVRYISYQLMKRRFWEHLLNVASFLEQFDVVQLTLLLDEIGHFSDEEVNEVFYRAGKSPWSQDLLTKKEVIEALQSWKNTSVFRRAKKCPLCSRKVQVNKHLINSKLNLENDLVTHFAICSAKDKKLLKASYVSSDFASKRWFSKLLINLTYGKYALGSNNANILVQDRDTGIVVEEKISMYVRLGIRIIYNAKGKQSKKFRALLRFLTIKQGRKFDKPDSIKEIKSFIKFHSLDMSQCLDTEFKTFNEFFYRKLKPGSRPPESDDPKILISPADSRCSVFSTISKSMQIWIKGKFFTLYKLTAGYYSNVYNERTSGIAIFRLAPQDYHRFHSPCNGVIGKPKFISGEYYTVNPMAVRTDLDVFGENVRIVIPIESDYFGTLLYIPVGAMMVGSIILTCKEGEYVDRGQELGYFKFGGSTVLLVFSTKVLDLDTDLVKNSEESIETLVKVGMSIGHNPDIKEYRRVKIPADDLKEIERIKRTITVSEKTAEGVDNTSWEYRTLKGLNTTNPEIKELFDVLSKPCP